MVITACRADSHICQSTQYILFDKCTRHQLWASVSSTCVLVQKWVTSVLDWVPWSTVFPLFAWNGKYSHSEEEYLALSLDLATRVIPFMFCADHSAMTHKADGSAGSWMFLAQSRHTMQRTVRRDFNVNENLFKIKRF